MPQVQVNQMREGAHSMSRRTQPVPANSFLPSQTAETCQAVLNAKLWCTIRHGSWVIRRQQGAGSTGLQRRMGKKGACLSNGVQVGKARQSFSTDVGDHVLVQGHIRSMHEVCDTPATTVFHHNPQRLTAAPTALYTTPDLTSWFAHGEVGLGRAEGWRMGGVGLWYMPSNRQCLPKAGTVRFLFPQLHSSTCRI